jgi:AbrB family looped-hinge helix DNA binding protein
MALGKVQSRGQITLPSEVRRAAQIKPGDTVNIRVIEPGKLEVRVIPRLSTKEIFEKFAIEGPIDLEADREAYEAEAAREVLGTNG